ncbi:MAG: hypothetical protein ACQEQV_09955 [Fibrobacterota bacterium]
MNKEERIEELEIFRGLICDYSHNQSPEVRSQINKKKAIIQREIVEAGCMKLMTIAPPPAVGGLVMNRVNPLDCIFNPPYGMSMYGVIVDMIDETIGVVSASDEVEMIEPTDKPSMKPTYQKGYAFIAMAINPEDHQLEDVLDSIKEASQKYDITAERIDENESNDRITDRILESIDKAQFVIVDLTHPKPNVFFEAGYAQGIGKIPIYIAREGTKLEFDLKDYPVIFFKNMRELKSGLQKRLEALGSDEN